MKNYSIAYQIKKEIEEFNNTKIQLATTTQNHAGVRYLKDNAPGYYFNQRETISLIDLYYNSKFENGQRDSLGQRKLFMNVGKFRTEVAAKQINLTVKDFRFIPDDYADPWVSIFLQKDFKEWAKDSEFSELLAECIDNLPKYGSIVLKKVARNIKWTPLQRLVVEQTAVNLQSATYVIEDHPDMYMWEISAMKNWNTDGFSLKNDDCATVYERYGHVPLGYINKLNGRPVTDEDWNTYVDALVICSFDLTDKNVRSNEHIFFAEEIKERPYRECHYAKQFGRWLGLGVMEDLVENQKAKNIIVNLIRRSLHWSAKRIWQSVNTDVTAKNLVKDVEDGAILDVGANGQLTEVPLSAKTNADFSAFLNEWEHNSDQKSFTYDVAVGALPAHTPYRLAIILSNAVASYYAQKKTKLGVFFTKVVTDFLVPQFIKDMQNQDKVVALFSGDPGFEVLKSATIEMVKSSAVNNALLNGNPATADNIQSAIKAFMSAEQLFFKNKQNVYQNLKYRFDLNITDESVDSDEKIKILTTIYQSLAAQGDPRAQKVLERIAILSGTDMAAFGSKPPSPPNTAAAPTTPANPQLNAQPQPAQLART